MGKCAKMALHEFGGIKMTDSIAANILGIVYILLVVGLVTLVLLQQSKSFGLGTLQGETPNYMQNNMGRTKNAIYAKMTIVLSVLIVALTIVLNIIS